MAIWFWHRYLELDWPIVFEGRDQLLDPIRVMDQLSIMMPRPLLRALKNSFDEKNEPLMN